VPIKPHTGVTHIASNNLQLYWGKEWKKAGEEEKQNEIGTTININLSHYSIAYECDRRN